MVNNEDDPERKKECPFSMTKMNKYFWIPFSVPVVCFSTKFFSEVMKTNDDTKKIEEVTDENIHTFVFLYQMINSTSLIFGGLLYFITIIRSQTDNKANIGTLNNIRKESSISDYSFMEKKKPNKLLEYSIIFSMSIIITAYNILKGYGAKHPSLEKRLYFLFFFCLIINL